MLRELRYNPSEAVVGVRLRKMPPTPLFEAGFASMVNWARLGDATDNRANTIEPIRIENISFLHCASREKKGTQLGCGCGESD
jgi:hypothetical protein